MPRQLVGCFEREANTLMLHGAWEASHAILGGGPPLRTTISVNKNGAVVQPISHINIININRQYSFGMHSETRKKQQEVSLAVTLKFY